MWMRWPVSIERSRRLRNFDCGTNSKFYPGRVAVKDLPESMRERLVKQSKNGTVKLGLQESYEFSFKTGYLGRTVQIAWMERSKISIVHSQRFDRRARICSRFFKDIR